MCGINVDTDALVRKYEPLIHSVISKKLPTYLGDEDLVQVGRIALWRSAKRYDPDKGKFSTYAYKGIYHAMLKELSKRKSEVSLNTPILGDDGDELQDTIPDLKQSIECAELRLELEEFFATLSPRKQDIFKRKADGQTSKEIANKLGTSTNYINQEVRRIGKMWTEFHSRYEEEAE